MSDPEESAETFDKPRTTHLRRFDVMQVSIWATRLRDVRAHHDELESDVDRTLARHRNSDAMGEQTLAVLQNEQGIHWDAYRAGLRSAVEALLADHASHLLNSELRISTWGLRLGRPDNYDESQLLRAGVHNHFPAFLSSIYYLRVPEALQEAGIAGTAFINEFPHGLVKSAPGTTVSPETGVLVLFPSWLLHTPLSFDYPRGVGDRVIIASDVYAFPPDSVAL